VLTGYALIYDLLSRRPAGGGPLSVVRPGAFDRWLARGLTVPATLNHDDACPVGGELALVPGKLGLRFRLDDFVLPEDATGVSLAIDVYRQNEIAPGVVEVLEAGVVGFSVATDPFMPAQPLLNYFLEVIP
jgi:phage head maturation protease